MAFVGKTFLIAELIGLRQFVGDRCVAGSSPLHFDMKRKKLSFLKWPRFYLGVRLPSKIIFTSAGV